MSNFPIIDEILESLDIQQDPVEVLPLRAIIHKNIALIIFPTQFDQWAFTVTVDNDQAVKWEESDIIEYFLDDETQYYLNENKITVCTSSNSVGLSMAVQPEKIQTYEISGFVRDAVEHLNRFIIEFTAVA